MSALDVAVLALMVLVGVAASRVALWLCDAAITAGENVARSRRTKGGRPTRTTTEEAPDA